MMVMSVPYESTGRTKQKARTRAALIEAGREFLSAGTTPTVEQAADAAGVSRTTAYRYFPNQRALIVATFPEIGAASLLPDTPPEDPAARLDAVVDALTSQMVEHEPELRAHLRLSLESANGERPELPFRTGRAIGWIEEALAPLRGQISEPDLRRLVLAIRSAVGIEALVWLTDIAKLSRDEAAELMSWSAQALLRSALAESG
jgi:AcrR family transcriptional regulator